MISMDDNKRQLQATPHSHLHSSSFAPPEAEAEQPAAEVVHYMLGPQTTQHHPASQQPTTTTHAGAGGQSSHATTMSSFDKLLSFSDVLHFANNFGTNDDLALNHAAASDGSENDGYFFTSRFQSSSSLPAAPPHGSIQQQHQAAVGHHECSKTTDDATTHDDVIGGAISESTTTLAQQQQHPDGGGANKRAADTDKQAELQGITNKSGGGGGRRNRKRPRTVKTSEEVESQRMTHIAVERNRRRQMNDYLRILRSLMPGSYVHRGDQASIIGGAIDFIRELEQLIQCLESQKRRRLYGGGSGDAPRPVVDAAAAPPPGSIQPHPTMSIIPFPTASSGGSAGDEIVLGLDVDDGGLREEVAENKSCLADIEVRALGADALIKILSRRRPGQLIKTIAALEDMQMTILHTNITTIDQTVLYSFNVKIAGDARFSAEDIAGAVHQILSFIDINYTM